MKANSRNLNVALWRKIKMKIIVYNYKNQFALSRKDIEVIANVLPKENILPIREFHLTFDETKPSIFEYSYETKKAYFAFPVKQKTSESLSKAVEQLLIVWQESGRNQYSAKC